MEEPQPNALVMAACPPCMRHQHSKCEEDASWKCLCEFHDHALFSKKKVKIGKNG